MIDQTIVARAAIFLEDKLLVVQRSNEGKADDGYWELPGGQVEPGEHPETAVRREAQEELGLKIEVGKVNAVDSVNYPLAAPLHQVVIIDYLCQLSPDQVVQDLRLSNEHIGSKLIAQTELGNLQPLRDMMRTSLQKAFQNYRSSIN